MSRRRVGRAFGVATAIVLLAAVVRYWPFDAAITIANDQAQYISLAEDYLRTGAFTESLTFRTAGQRFVPIGYPATIALVATSLAITAKAAALWISMLAGILIVVVAMHLIWRCTHRWAATVAAGLAVAINGTVTYYSTDALTETLWMLLLAVTTVMLLSLYRIKSLAGYVLGWALVGVGFVALFLVRASSLYLIVTIPLAYLGGLYVGRHRLQLRRFAVGTCVFLALSAGAIVWNARRLGTSATVASPQFSSHVSIAVNYREGDDLSGYRVNSNGELGLLAPSHNGTSLWALLQQVQLRSVLPNLGWSLFHLLVIGGLSAFLLTWALRGIFPDETAIQPPGTFTPQLAEGLGVLSVVFASHLLACCVFSAAERYLEQVSVVAMLLVVLLSVHFERTLPDLRWLAAWTCALGLIAGLKNLPRSFHQRGWHIERLGDMVRVRAKESGNPAVLSSTSYNVAYYAKAHATYILPHAEDRPDRLLDYFQRKQVDFVYAPMTYGMGRSETIDIPARAVLDLLSERGVVGIDNMAPGLGLFHLKRSVLPSIRAVAASEKYDVPRLVLTAFMPDSGIEHPLCSSGDGAATPCLRIEKTGDHRRIIRYYWLEPGEPIDTLVGRGQELQVYALESAPN